MKIALGGDEGTEWSCTGEDSGLSETQEKTIEKDCTKKAFGGER